MIRRLAVWALAGWSLPAAALTVEQAVTAHLRQGAGPAQPLIQGAVLAPATTVETADAGAVDLALQGFGRLELGGSASLSLLQMPAPANDEVTHLRLARGYLRLRWQTDLSPRAWPMVVDIDSGRLSLAQGEYFIESRPGATTFCIAAGRAALAIRGRSAPVEVAGKSCHRVRVGQAPQAIAFAPRALQRAPAIRQLSVALAGGTQAQPLATPPSPSRTAAFAAALRQAISGRPAEVPLRVARGPAPAPQSWTVFAGSFPQQPEAERYLQELERQGFLGAQIMAAEVNGRIWHRVAFAGLPTRSEADTLLLRLRRDAAAAGAWLQGLR